MKHNWLALTLPFAGIAFLIWLSDAITMQGERTIYAVRCEQGNWISNACSGTVLAAERYRYRALMAHGEVLFWVAGSPEPSGTLTQCVIRDGRSWFCKANADVM